MTIEEIKKKLKALNGEYAKIRELPKEERKAFGVKLNKQRE